MPQMSQFMSALIASGTILIIILATDIGRRRITTMRMVRSVIAVAIVIAIFVESFPTKGNDLSLQLVGVGTGVICGLIAGVLLPAYKDAATSGDLYTIGGIGYALVWIVLSSGRILFAYGAEHWFTMDLVKFSIDYKISGQDTYANAFVFMSLAMVLTRTAVLLAKMRKLKGQDTASAQLPQQTTTGASV
ncbi:Integral membrane protein OS=Streptomyces antimycoticus OX=68175 GN=SANT12839_037400 PE=4 SV=1 [Streptomyces antimycoticus]